MWPPETFARKAAIIRIDRVTRRGILVPTTLAMIALSHGCDERSVEYRRIQQGGRGSSRGFAGERESDQLSSVSDDFALPPGLKPCEQPFRHVLGGEVDWTRGIMRVEGKGYPKPGQNILMAKRAALLDAARNAIVLAAALPLDDSHRLRTLANWQRRVEGRVKGHREVKSYTVPGTNPPEYRVVIEVPLWGVSGVVETLVADQRQRIARSANARRDVPSPPAPRGESITIVIDARGLRGVGGRSIDPTLFPTVVDDRGNVIYDVASVSQSVSGYRPVVRYARSDLPLNRIGQLLRPTSSRRFMLASFRGPAQRESKQPPASPRTDKPDEGQSDSAQSNQGQAPDVDSKPRRRPRRPPGKIAPFRSRNYDGRFHVAEETYKDMVQTPGFKEAIKNAEVIIVVDAPSAGREAHRPQLLDDLVLLTRTDR